MLFSAGLNLGCFADKTLPFSVVAKFIMWKRSNKLSLIYPIYEVIVILQGKISLTLGAASSTLPKHKGQVTRGIKCDA